MGEKIVVGPINQGLTTNRTAFVIDNDSFPTLINAYQWRGRVKRKRGTSFLGRLTRYFNSTSTSYSSTSSIALVGGAANILTGFSLQTNGNIVPGSVTIANITVAQTYTDNSLGILTGGSGGTGTINYATGVITITGGSTNSITAIFRYYPDLPVMGLEDFQAASNNFPGTIGFDTTYAYNINNTNPYSIYSVSFYKNPATTTFNGQTYTQKTNETPVKWNGQDYQQFWTTNYQGALWATNGISIPFVRTNVGMQYKAITNVVIVSAGPPASVTLTVVAHGLVVGDYIFINEVVGNTGINFQTGYVTAVGGVDTITVGLPYATVAGSYSSGGIAQYLTNTSDSTKDCMRWYDGDPTDGSVTNPALTGHKGWVNFCPPLFSGLPSFGIADTAPAQYYLVTARLVVPFKDRLLFFGPVIQTSVAGSQVYLQDTIIYSQNGTPYYTASFTGTVTSSATTFVQLLTPTDQLGNANAFSASPASYFEDITGFGGFFTTGLDQNILSVSTNEDVLIVGYNTFQTRLIYTGNDVSPFNLYVINSEYGTGSTFSAINLDKGVMSYGSRGFIMTSQTGAARFDLQIPDNAFQINLLANGNERICAVRDFINEWVYFTYRSNLTSSATYKFPTQTLFYNYRDESWGIFNECYTTYGLFRKVTGLTWGTLPATLTWGTWTDPWNSGEVNLLQPDVIAGNQQGFIVFRDEDIEEATSLYIRSVSGNTITSPDHCLNDGDFIIISGCIGLTGINGFITQIRTITQNTFVVTDLTITGTYLGGGLIQRTYVPFIQTKQFAVAWNMQRKTRIGPQQYLLSKTANSQITLIIYLSENTSSPYSLSGAYNIGPILPSEGSVNDSLIYSTVLYTCPESTNLGLTPANVNLNLITASNQQQIWHRMNTSLLGDTVQFGFTLSKEQMLSVDLNNIPINAFSEVELHGFIVDTQPSQLLC